ncbi:hypothetical protein [Holospora curviuscula]|uniref:Uncharacterized protein n=1 Tax=Holospora curviuscula TaxID=1082868 RepID=A0A2S5R9A4_9PROT|nr:hypothetical protein [Holospora curviuscula]PPE03880.1 hypothetical protein HCUR_00659 [Holospora curviuscula]
MSATIVMVNKNSVNRERIRCEKEGAIKPKTRLGSKETIDLKSAQNKLSRNDQQYSS